MCNLIERLLVTIRAVYNVELHLPIVPLCGHYHSNTKSCNNNSIKFFPFQGENFDICGVAAIISAILFTNTSIQCSLFKKIRIPKLAWLSKLQHYADYARWLLIMWFIKNKIDESSIGILKIKDDENEPIVVNYKCDNSKITDGENEPVVINYKCDSKDEVIWSVGQKFKSIVLVVAFKTI
ncbi:uncharacterized protein LOC136088574 [Hydra vulgaris]|uniref:Uncharacterized protein LOC136088574 n=1 Tax=Hydra vulgaris TaxID=6087 RepID=A0ABM4D2W7_HYDVU